MRAGTGTALLLLIPLAIACDRRGNEALQAWGTVESRTVDVGSRSPARVESVLVEEGDAVKAGQELVRLDLSELEAQRDQAAAAAAAADAQLRLLEAGSRAEDISAARQALSAAEDRQQQAERDLARARTLVAQSAASVQTEQDATTALQVAQADVQSRRANLQKLATGARAQEIEAAAAQKAQAEAGVRRIDDLLQDRILAAPVDGSVLDRLTEPGEVVRAGAPLLRLGETGRPYIDVYVPEPRVGEVRPGGDVTVKLDAYPDRTFPGRVRHLATEAEFTPKNVQTADQRARLVFRVRVDVLANEVRALPGMPGSVTFAPPAEAKQ